MSKLSFSKVELSKNKLLIYAYRDYKFFAKCEIKQL